jgi:hypothetical protein
MKRILLFIVSAVLICLPQWILGQGTTYVSTLGGTPIGSAAVGADSWIAQTFFAGTNAAGYFLNSIQLQMNSASGGPTGFSVAIYSNPGNHAPGSSLVALTGPEPSLGGVFTYGASNFLLQARTEYSVVVTAATLMAEGAYYWSAVDSLGTGIIGSERWNITDSYYSSANGSSWTNTIRQEMFQLAINATPVPEPSTFALWAAAIACLSLWRGLPPRRARGEPIERS